MNRHYFKQVSTLLKGTAIKKVHRINVIEGNIGPENEKLHPNDFDFRILPSENGIYSLGSLIDKVREVAPGAMFFISFSYNGGALIIH